MYCRVIACDFDGTGASNGRMAPEVSGALEAARTHGIVTLLVTGRVLEDLQAVCGDLSPFDAIVAENGAVIWLCGLERMIQVGTPPPEHFLGELRARGVPFHTGSVVVGTWEHHAAQLLELVRQFGIDGQLTFNRSALMLLPSGVNKAVGVRRALEELGRSERNLIAFGDAENDLSLLSAAEVGVAARGAVAAVAAQADDRLSQPDGAGVALYIRRLVENNWTLPTPARHQLVLGKTAGDKPATLPSSGMNLVISGDPRSGKSWMAGLIAEQLIERGYILCIIDPEGDYISLGQRARVMALGHDLALPAPAAVPRLFASEPVSLILNLSSLALHEQAEYVDALLCGLEETRSISGIPHWILIDEAHYFFHDTTPCLRRLNSETGNFILVTYRPSLIASDIYGRIKAHVITACEVEEERYFMTKLLQARGPRGLIPHEALQALQIAHAGLLMEGPDGSTWQVFLPSQRVTPHAHHARKYAETRLPDDKAFRFLYTDVPVLAHNMNEFYKAIQSVPIASLRHHLRAGDFSKWAAGILGDEQLAHGLRKLERTAPPDATPDRTEILAHIEDHYLIQEQ
jgi:hydroxymethylpyrimidine pyrophosphatase-like HAD family hydrolase